MLAAIEWSQGIEDAWSRVATTVPKLIYFLAVLLIGLFIVKIITGVVRRIAGKAHLDDLLDKASLGHYVRRAGLTGSELVARSVKFFLTFVVLTTAFGVFGPNNPLSRLIDRFVLILPRLIVAAAIIVITGLVAQFARNTLLRLRGAAEGVQGVKVPDVAVKAAPVAIWVIGAFAAVDQLGIAENITRTLFTATLAALVGIAIVAIGGSGIVPMRARWDAGLAKWDAAKNAPATIPVAPPVQAPVAGE
jgi:hypothetical protein